MDRNGLSMPELLIVLALIAIAALLVVPAAAEIARQDRVTAAAREIAMTLHALRWQSVAEGRSRGLFFEQRNGEWIWREVADGNGNGLRTAEVRDGTDPILSIARRPAGHDLGVVLGLPPGGPIPRIPPARGTLGTSVDPVRFGRSDLVSFSPLGAASSGTVYVTDGKNLLCGVVLFGPTARVRVWRYDRRTRTWTL